MYSDALNVVALKNNLRAALSAEIPTNIRRLHESTIRFLFEEKKNTAKCLFLIKNS